MRFCPTPRQLANANNLLLINIYYIILIYYNQLINKLHSIILNKFNYEDIINDF